MTSINSLNSNYSSRFSKQNLNVNFSGATNPNSTEQDEKMSTAAKFMIGATALAGLAALYIVTRGKGASSTSTSSVTSNLTEEAMQLAVKAKQSAQSAIDDALKIFKNQDELIKPVREMGDEANKFVDDVCAKGDEVIDTLSNRPKTLRGFNSDDIKNLNDGGTLEYVDDLGNVIETVNLKEGTKYFSPDGKLLAKLHAAAMEVYSQKVPDRVLYKVLNTNTDMTVLSYSETTGELVKKVVKQVGDDHILPNMTRFKGQITHYECYDEARNLAKKYSCWDGAKFEDGTKIRGYNLDGQKISTQVNYVDKNGLSISLNDDFSGQILNGNNVASYNVDNEYKILSLSGSWDGKTFS